MAKKSQAVKKPKRTIKRMSDHGMMETMRALVDGSGMSRYEIARQTGLSQSILSRAYNGQRCPPGYYLMKVAEVVGAKVTIQVDW